uniref:Uncharacterized protein n=1 Tax=Echinococcus granulosus TaxID=6210 RepID=A0A068WDM3_ECHGR|nr:hypothetical protein EgrG_002020100 [Echinococcus granulosus]
MSLRDDIWGRKGSRLHYPLIICNELILLIDCSRVRSLRDEPSFSTSRRHPSSTTYHLLPLTSRRWLSAFEVRLRRQCHRAVKLNTHIGGTALLHLHASLPLWVCVRVWCTAEVIALHQLFTYRDYDRGGESVNGGVSSSSAETGHDMT